MAINPLVKQSVQAHLIAPQKHSMVRKHFDSDILQADSEIYNKNIWYDSVVKENIWGRDKWICIHPDWAYTSISGYLLAIRVVINSIIYTHKGEDMELPQISQLY